MKTYNWSTEFRVVVFFSFSFQLSAKKTFGNQTLSWQFMVFSDLKKQHLRETATARLLFHKRYTAEVFSWQLDLLSLELLCLNVHMYCTVTMWPWLMSKRRCELALYLPLSRLHPTGMLYKQEVRLPWATSLIVFFALSPPQATLIPQIP